MDQEKSALDKLNETFDKMWNVFLSSNAYPLDKDKVKDLCYASFLSGFNYSVGQIKPRVSDVISILSECEPA